MRISYYRNLTEAEATMVDGLANWLLDEGKQVSTSKLYRHLVSKIIVLELKPEWMTVQEKTAWNALTDYLEVVNREVFG